MLKPTTALPLKDLQQKFFAELLGQESTIINHIQSTEQWSAGARMGIYSSGYRLRLKEAIETDFDRLFSYLGDDLFNRLLDAYIDRYPSHHTSLRHYSKHLLELIKNLEPFSSYPEIYELTQIETAFNYSFDAANCSPVKIDFLTEIKAEEWPSMKIRFHASLQRLTLKTNSMEIWKALSNQLAPPPLANEPANWIIWRKHLVSQYRAIDAVESGLLSRAMRGESFAELCESMIGSFPEQDIPVKMMAYLQLWIEDKMIDSLGEITES